MEISQLLLQHENFAHELKNYIKEIQNWDHDNGLNEQIKWDFLKRNIRKFSNAFSKSLKKEKYQKIQNLENKIKVLEIKLFRNKNMYNTVKED